MTVIGNRRKNQDSRSGLLHSVVEASLDYRRLSQKANQTKTTITKGLMEALVSMYTTNPLLIKRMHVSRSFRLSPEFKMMVWTIILLILFKFKLN